MRADSTAMAGSPLDWGALDEALAGDVLLPGSSAYDARHEGFNARFHGLLPQAIVSCASPEDVSETVSFLRRHGVEIAVRSGGHCFAGRSSTRGALIDVTPMDSVAVSGGVATVGAGARLGDVYDALGEQGLAIPAGTCPPVGIAGLALGGGLGILGRSYGVTSDRMVRAQVVVADGRILDCDDDHHADLFWALRGAGAGNFGVVTSITLRPVPAPEVSNAHASWPFADANAVIRAWQEWAPNGPDELAASLKVTAAADIDERPSVDVYAALQGTESDAWELLDTLFVRVGTEPNSTSCRLLSFAETRQFWAQLGAAENQAGPDPASTPHPYLFTKSEFFGHPLPAEAVAALTDNFSRARTAGETRELDFMPWGGAYNRTAPDATAFVHRNELFQLKHAAVVDPNASTTDKEAANRWVVGSWATVHPWGSGRVFPNFADPDLDHQPDAYYGTNYHRLLQIKGRYDPGSSFHFR
jgi:FAD/FMN-containing dehydrogenase